MIGLGTALTSLSLIPVEKISKRVVTWNKYVSKLLLLDFNLLQKVTKTIPGITFEEINFGKISLITQATEASGLNIFNNSFQPKNFYIIFF